MSSEVRSLFVSVLTSRIDKEGQQGRGRGNSVLLPDCRGMLPDGDWKGPNDGLDVSLCVGSCVTVILFIILLLGKSGSRSLTPAWTSSLYCFEQSQALCESRIAAIMRPSG